MSKTIQEKIQELEEQGWTYERDYVTGKHILSEVLIKRWVDDDNGSYKTLVKYIEKGKIKDYSK